MDDDRRNKYKYYAVFQIPESVPYEGGNLVCRGYLNEEEFNKRYIEELREGKKLIAKDLTKEDAIFLSMPIAIAPPKYLMECINPKTGKIDLGVLASRLLYDRRI